ncbi:hypothetical protein KIN20_003593 [Parelaphostrongylus tenuis]|uniref:Uncharacterized protein n=1 Tax=Parelaphostrongylus tenuis TaxID=148309 RepID=A0AAD5LX06_PARTN|nr:hypothetical protein KIN20_003593 [Parelaphostrongylus tenuis]
MPSATLFLHFSLLAGVLLPTVYGYSRKLRRSDVVEQKSTIPLEPEAMNSDLPPLPLNFDDQDYIYMSLDDPRVGTEDAEGNVLVPVDENGAILPGYEHLIRPVLVHENGDSERVQGDAYAASSKDFKLSSSAMTTDDPKEEASDLEDIIYDEKDSKAFISELPFTRDYVDSIENNVSKNAQLVSVRLKSSGLDETIKSEDENDNSGIEGMVDLARSNQNELGGTESKAPKENKQHELSAAKRIHLLADSSEMQQLVKALELDDKDEVDTDSKTSESKESWNNNQNLLHAVEEVAKLLPTDTDDIDNDDESVRNLLHVARNNLELNMKQEEFRSESALLSTTLSICVFTTILFF